MAQRRQLEVEPIDPRFELRHVLLGNDRLLDAGRDPVRGIGQPRADRKQLALHRHAHLVEIRRQPGRPRHAEARLQFVHLAVGRDAKVGLAHAGAVEEARLARIPSLRVDLHVREL